MSVNRKDHIPSSVNIPKVGEWVIMFYSDGKII